MFKNLTNLIYIKTYIQIIYIKAQYIVSSGSELDDETNQDGKSPIKIFTAGDILGLFEKRFQKFGYMYIIGDQRTAMVRDFSVERSYAEIILFSVQKLIPCCFVNSCLD